MTSEEVTPDKAASAGSLDDDSCEVVLRRSPRKAVESVLSFLERKDGRRVKWSQSTEVREKMKEVRRSQMDLTLDYHHIAEDEKREKEGVKLWRTSITVRKQVAVEDEEDNDILHQLVDSATKDQQDSVTASRQHEETDSNSSGDQRQSDLFSDSGNDEMEWKIKIIHAATSRYTLLPAYRAAVEMYDPWLQSPENTKTLSEEELKQKQKQCEIYHRVLDLYGQWKDGEIEADQEEHVHKSFGEVLELLQEAKQLGDPPQTVCDAMATVLNDEANEKKRSALFNDLLDKVVEEFGLV